MNKTHVYYAGDLLGLAVWLSFCGVGIHSLLVFAAVYLKSGTWKQKGDLSGIFLEQAIWVRE